MLLWLSDELGLQENNNRENGPECSFFVFDKNKSGIFYFISNTNSVF
jgi:hypothetical protein